jgi:iron complex outermembrane receptor protein
MYHRLLTTTALAFAFPAAANGAEHDAAAVAAVTVSAADADAGETGQDIVVTGQPLGRTADETTIPVTILEGDALVYRRQATIGETLMREPGIRADTFGGGAARPVIRGQTSPRIRVLSDGAQIQDASDVSPDHATVGEPLLLRAIEVLRGPASLLYGGGAISGAVNLIDTRIPDERPGGGFDGVFELRGGTADDERTAVGGATLGAGPFALRAEGVYRDSDDYRAPDREERRVHGTFNETRTGTIGASWIGDDGHFGIAYTRQDSRYGVPGHNHDYEGCHPHGTHLHCGGHGHQEEEEHEHGEEEHADVSVDLRSERVDLRGELRSPLPAIERIRLRAGLTDYRHHEIEAEHDDGEGDHGHGGGGEGHPRGGRAHQLLQPRPRCPARGGACAAVRPARRGRHPEQPQPLSHGRRRGVPPGKRDAEHRPVPVRKL